MKIKGVYVPSYLVIHVFISNAVFIDMQDPFNFTEFAAHSPYHLDSNITEFVAEYFPANHTPLILNRTVYTMADLYNLVSVNEKDETITVKLWLYLAYIVEVSEQEWNHRLPYLYRIYPGKGNVWKPDVIIMNSIETIQTNFEQPVIKKSLCECESSDNPPGYCDDRELVYCATVVVFPIVSTEVLSCSFDVRDFPFDTQTCKIEIGPWYSDLDEYPSDTPYMYQPYNLKHPDGPGLYPMSLRSYQVNSQWELRSAEMSHSNRESQHEKLKRFELIVYTLELKRKPQFYIFTLVLPCSILTFLAVFSIFLPVESGEKMGLGITLMLAQVVNLLILSGLIPASSEYFPRLGYYFLITIVLLAVSLIYNVVVIIVYTYDYRQLFSRAKTYKTEISAVDNATLYQVEENQESADGAVQNQTPTFEDILKDILNEHLKVIKSQDKDCSTCSQVETKHTTRKLCILSDHIFGLIVFVTVLVVHIAFFAEFLR